jgi:hypothetical protein
MEKIKNIINSDWFNSAAAGLVAGGFAIYGHWFVAGIALGFGIKTFLNIFKTVSPQIYECECESCECDCCKK